MSANTEGANNNSKAPMDFIENGIREDDGHQGMAWKNAMGTMTNYQENPLKGILSGPMATNAIHYGV